MSLNLFKESSGYSACLLNKYRRKQRKRECCGLTLQVLFQIFTREEVRRYIELLVVRPDTAGKPRPSMPTKDKKQAKLLILYSVIIVSLIVLALPLMYIIYLYPTYARDKCDAYPVND
jgi:hypothetical protein